jgi:uncharacterized protein (DUF2235 family)
MLFAFDGTWNSDKAGVDQDTNVCWCARAYTGKSLYLPGVGTRFGALGQVVGGMTGAGGRTRIDEALAALSVNLDTDDDIIDVVGFSRGAALALHFCNEVESRYGLPIRFLGLWDCVPSFGVASIDLNIGWRLDLPDNVQTCYHALALDERRHTFHLHRLNARVDDANQEGRLFELWFRGVHSDIGGGNDNPRLSSIALAWMFKAAERRGLPLDAAVVHDNEQRQAMGRGISDAPWYDLIKNPRRVVRWNDRVHASVTFVPDRNNPPIGVMRVDHDGLEVGPFARVL